MPILDCEDDAYYPTDQIILTGQRKRFNIGIHSQCLTAAQGWVCCGGEHGEFSAAKLGTIETLKSGNFEIPNSFFASHDSPIAVAKSARFVRERVNCVTIWFPQDQQPQQTFKIIPHHGAYNEPVAVLSNNDKTVTLVSLNSFSDGEEPQSLCSLTYPDFVNRAVISPDCQFLAAVLDDPYLYIHHRTENEEWSSGSDEKDQFHWKLCAKILLKSQFESDKTDRRGSFALAFSPSGQYLAVGTQHGVVSVFRTDRLAKDSDNALVKTFNSSRAGDRHGNGAIRDMAFCPGKYGLLAWTEDRGRVGIADIKSNFSKRQIIKLGESSSFGLNAVLDPNVYLAPTSTANVRNAALLARELHALASELPSSTSDEATQIPVFNRVVNPPPAPAPASRNLSFDPRLLENLRHAREREQGRSMGYQEGNSAPRRAYARSTDSTDNTNNSLSALVTPSTSSRSMLQSALLVSSLRLSHRHAANSINTANTLLSDSNSTNRGSNNTIDDPDNSSSDFAWDSEWDENPYPVPSARHVELRSNIRSFLDDWRQAPLLPGGSQITGEARSNIQLPNQAHVEVEGETQEPLLTSGNTRPMVTQRDRQSSNESSLHSSFWANNEPSNPVTTPTNRRMMGSGPIYREYMARRNNSLNALTSGRDNTSGMAWSTEGDTLYVGSEDGIYEMHVNTSYWKIISSIQLR
ncbi:hypothetical protein Cpir12675_003023 [Ceratocystis pirilliformis]|uniref:DUF2415 domain-containing protein n=1 Tax=Ceratocystis pirilliformis TaxID=259994 RepID=A0ABR3Z615_9PEZI